MNNVRMTEIIPREPRDEVSIEIFNEASPNSLVSLVPNWMVPHFQKLLNDELVGEAYMQGESILKKVLVNHHDFTVSPLDTRLRHAFWVEYHTAIETGQKMRETPLYMHGCSRDQYFYVIKDLARFSWIVCPPLKMSLHLSAMLEHAMGRLDEIINAPLYNKKGEFDAKNASIVMKAAMMLELKVNGSQVQRHEHELKALHVNMSEEGYKRKIEEAKRELGYIEETPVTPVLTQELVKTLQERENEVKVRPRDV